MNVYRIKFKCGGWVTTSTRYFSASSAGEALVDINYAMQHNMITSNKIIIHKVQMYNRFSGKWEMESIDSYKSIYKVDSRDRLIIQRT